jgi:hypothetical protein
MSSNLTSLSSRVKNIQSGIKRSISSQKKKIQNNPTSVQGGIPSGNTEVEQHQKFKDVITRGRDNPVAQKVYQHFSKFGDEIAKRAVVVSGLESNWRQEAGVNNSVEKSFGPFQINLDAHNQRVAKYSGSNSIEQNAKWRQNIDNSLIIAEEIYKEQGFKPWTVARKKVNTPIGVLGNNIMDL